MHEFQLRIIAATLTDALLLGEQRASAYFGDGLEPMLSRTRAVPARDDNDQPTDQYDVTLRYRSRPR